MGRAISLARTGDYAQARLILTEVVQQNPRHAAALRELGGIAFREKRHAEAARWLRRARAAEPADTYAAEFLSAIHQLHANAEAAALYAAPVLAGLAVTPEPTADPVFVDSLFPEGPGQRATPAGIRTLLRRASALGAFAAPSVRLTPAEQGESLLTLTSRERNGMGRLPAGFALNTLRGIGFLALQPEYGNIARSGWSWSGFLRFDPDKLQFRSRFDGPLRGDAARHITVDAGYRRENWQVGTAAFRFERTAASIAIEAMPLGDWGWRAALELSHRDHSAFWPFPTGPQAKQSAGLFGSLLERPQYRLSVRWRADGEIGRIWSPAGGLFGRAMASLETRYQPGLDGNTWTIEHTAFTGVLRGNAPFDEYFQLGLERDNNLPLRAHIGTRAGRKGSAPIGARYALSNFTATRHLFRIGLVTIGAGPFFDAGRMDTRLGLAPNQWMADTGIETRIGILDTGLRITYGRDLRTGRDAFYVSAGGR